MKPDPEMGLKQGYFIRLHFHESYEVFWMAVKVDMAC